VQEHDEEAGGEGEEGGGEPQVDRVERQFKILVDLIDKVGESYIPYFTLIYILVAEQISYFYCQQFWCNEICM